MQFEVSKDSLKKFAPLFWDHVNDAKVFAFHGRMGAGKTTIISTLAQFKGTGEVTSSPTFSIINEYRYADSGMEKSFFHIDLYRLNDEQEVIQAGVEDCVYSGEICMVEWPEKALFLFDENTVHVYIDTISENERRVKVKLPHAQ